MVIQRVHKKYLNISNGGNQRFSTPFGRKVEWLVTVIVNHVLTGTK